MRSLINKLKWYAFPNCFQRLKVVECVDDFKLKKLAKNDRRKYYSIKLYKMAKIRTKRRE